MSPRSRPPTLAQPKPPSLPPVTRHTLANGLEVYLVPRAGLPVVDVRFFVRGGAAGDDPPHAGRTWMLGQLLDQGTGSRSAMDIADEAELLGASLETRTGWDSVTVSLHVPSSRLVPALELVADVALDPTFPDEELERKRSERLAAILQESDEPRVLATQAFNRAAYGRHPYALPAQGTRKTIERLSRNAITAVHDRLFRPDEACLIMVGDVSEEAALPLIERLFGFRAAGPDRHVAAPEKVPGRATSVHIVDRPGAPQSELRVGRPGPPRDTPDYFRLLVANTILGGSFTSRLNMRLREEKAYTYGAGSSFAFRAEGGPFVASTAVATAATADAVSVMVTEIGRMSGERVGAEELERAKSYIVLGLPRTFETTGDIAEHVSEVALFGLGLDYYDRYAAEVRNVTADDVRAASEQWLRTDDLTIAIAGDADRVTGELESLELGTVVIDVDEE